MADNSDYLDPDGWSNAPSIDRDRRDGHPLDFIDIGPECFASGDREVICWQGVNYYRAPE